MDSNIVRTRVKKSIPERVHSKQKNFSIVVFTYTNRFKFSYKFDPVLNQVGTCLILKIIANTIIFLFCTKSKNLISNLLESLKKCTLF